MTSTKMVELVHAKRWEKRSGTNFYWWSWEKVDRVKILLVCVSSIQLGGGGVSGHFVGKNFYMKTWIKNLE